MTGRALLRVGTRSDMRAVAQLYQAVGFSDPGGIRLRDEYLVIYERRRLLGSLLYWMREAGETTPPNAVYAGKSWLQVHEIAVLPDRQSQGFGRWLLNAAAEVRRGQVAYVVCSPSRHGDLQRRIQFFENCGMTRARGAGGYLEMYGSPEAILAATGS